MHKWQRGNEVWAYAIVEQTSTSNPEPSPAIIQAVLDKFADLFQEPRTLPPK